jgi:hypothetical protein
METNMHQKRRWFRFVVAVLGLVLVVGASVGTWILGNRTSDTPPFKAPVPRPTTIITPRPSIDPNQLMRDVRTLASPEMQGRGAGRDGGRKARAFLGTRFETIGLERMGTVGYMQPFYLEDSDIECANVVGRIMGTDPNARSFVISAHYDHLGVTPTGEFFPGADDNASGVAALLAVANVIKTHPLRHAAFFVAFDAEEIGLHGSVTFVQHPPVPLPSFALDINFDMVSRGDHGEIYAAGAFVNDSNYRELKPLLEEVGRRAKVKLVFGHDTWGTQDDWTLRTDSGAFHQVGVPFVHFGVEEHSDYHKVTDTPDKIEQTFFANVVVMLLDATQTFDRNIP